MITLTFPDGAKREIEQGQSAAQVAQSISKSLEKKAVAAMVNGTLGADDGPRSHGPKSHGDDQDGDHEDGDHEDGDHEDGDSDG